MPDRIICVLGPTASGKTALAVELALALHGEVVGCDSMQIYRGLDIGTAKPTRGEMRGVPHHMIDVCDAGESYSAARYVAEATEAIEGILSRGHTAIVAGGTGLYMDSLILGRGFSTAENCDIIRKRLNDLGTKYGSERLHRLLRARDPKAAERIHPNDLKRIVRALEVSFSGGSISCHDEESRALPPRFEALKIGLDFRDRAELYRRTDLRVDEMLRAGLMDEAARLRREGAATALQAIGYKEMLPALDRPEEYPECVERLKRATRRYAKRQLTWFRRDGAVKWFYRDEEDFTSIVRRSTAFAEDFLYNSGVERREE